MFKMHDEVRIKSNGAIGTIIDIDSKGMVTVEGHKGETLDGSVYGDEFPLYYVNPDDLAKVDPDKSGIQISNKIAML